ncbi:hypothetical protein [Haliangium sp.]|uniref:hypothetical protein n=1 Tax=Haliangium sp. TaxID=2663208 RepID=UPI003D14E561
MSTADASPHTALARAREHCFMAGVDDTGMALCEANVPYGLAKIHHAQAQRDLPPDATFVGAPDATVTRNPRRWQQGFGYGGVYQWSGDMAVLDIKPNACGMSVGALPELPQLEELQARLHELDRAGLALEGVALDNDLTESNHFVDLFELGDRLDDEPLPAPVAQARYVYVMHSSGHEHRGPSPTGPGLYWDQSDTLAAMAEVVHTPWGRLHVLTGDAAQGWHRFYKQVEDFNHRRRETIAKFLFGPHEVLINATHQGLVRSLNQANIGCYTFDQPGALFPLTLSPSLPAFLVRARPNVAEAHWDTLGWSDRAERHDLAARLRNTNLLPHGGGYTYPQLRGIGRVLEDGPDARRFELLPADPGAAPHYVDTPRGLPYDYRGMEVKERMEALDLGRAALRLDLRYVLTA